MFYILSVDDEKDIFDLFSEYLISNRFNTISFQNPLKTLEYFNKNVSNCSLVIVDYKMPQMSGIDFIKKIREKDTADCKIKTMIISAFIKDTLPYNKSYITVDKILEKPVYLEGLKREVQELISINIQQKMIVK
jgi:response regulator RpfG family c-di-GMP phosphodiesterase